MEKLRYFFTCYLNQSFGFENLEDLIRKFRTSEHANIQLQFITELHQIKQTKNYKLAALSIEKDGQWSFKNDLVTLEKLLHYIYDRLIDRPTTVKALDFVSNLKYISCPSCSPEEKKDSAYKIIKKAIITKNNRLVYICKQCSLIWLTENISLETAQDYKEYMKSLGLHGSWKELHDVEIY